MAWIFALSAECGPSEAAARDIARHMSSWPTAVHEDRESNWWCVAAPDGLSRIGPQTDAEAEAMTTAGHLLYDRLRTAPPRYRYALAGVEADDFRTYTELLAEDDLTSFHGLVLEAPTWVAVGRPAAFVPFAAGHRWIPYAGEQRLHPADVSR